MFEVYEVVHLFVGILLFIYYLSIKSRHVLNIPKYWEWAIIIFVFSNIFTVLEGVVANTLFNTLEHLFFAVASILLFIGFLNRQPQSE